jgi:cobalt/nickel transport system permease protein
MLNFPLGAGVSAHLLGAVLVATLVGPWAGMLVIFSVVLVQALLFQDGGIAALGANALNLAVIGVGGGYATYRWVLALVGVGPRRVISAASVAAYVSALLVGAAAAVELALSDTLPFETALIAVVGSHALVGLGEAFLTGALLTLVYRTQPGLIAKQETPSGAERGWAYGLAAVSLLVAILAAYGASSRPDAFEAAIKQLGIEGTPLTHFTGPFADYTAPIGGPWVAAALGVAFVFALGWSLARLMARAGRRR